MGGEGQLSLESLFSNLLPFQDTIVWLDVYQEKLVVAGERLS